MRFGCGGRLKMRGRGKDLGFWGIRTEYTQRLDDWVGREYKLSNLCILITCFEAATKI